MTIRIEIDEAKGIAYIKVYGCLYESDIRQAFKSVISSSDYKKGMYRLWDLSEADLSTIDNASLESLAKVSADYSPEMDRTKVAVVAPQDLEFGMMRVYERISERKDYLFSPFRTLAEAEKWLMTKE
ncbi:MAG: hypothetical protein MJE63_23275 [Proteobacteria bacterium]|nr:hypothetical protein [Pseudomonadota bacterium]